ncbi:hypothetical protein BN2476_630101 [Paraburkholderia piptadeniae]|uniref:Uncharacterized protein n=1 Tax=Paraburkholderia piptadeniae TaxID=1701573 RepID=A0A1N7SLJ1_9BURK|nr:hypothetical protein BN2476_630101 [Paraburkholderia piptadeniae]
MDLVGVIADGPEWPHGWTASAAERLRFLLDFGYATGLRAGELVGATLGGIESARTTSARGAVRMRTPARSFSHHWRAKRWTSTFAARATRESGTLDA